MSGEGITCWGVPDFDGEVQTIWSQMRVHRSSGLRDMHATEDGVCEQQYLDAKSLPNAEDGKWGSSPTGWQHYLG